MRESVTCPNASWALNDAGTACIPTGALVTCGSTQVTISVDVDHLYADLDSSYYSSATIEFGTCSGSETPAADGSITETFNIDECGGDWSQSGNIVVDFDVKGAEAAISTTVDGETILLTSVLSFAAHCEYSSSATLTTTHAVDEDDVTAEEVVDTTGTFDDQFTLDWFSADTRAISDKTTLTLGDTVYLRAASTLPIGHQFFLNTCSASQGSKSISLLSHCGQDADTATALALNNPGVLSTTPIDWSFTAFAISGEALSLDIECDVTICATDSSGDPLDATCGVCETTTPINYASVEFSQIVDVQSDYSQIDRRLSTSYLSDGSLNKELYIKTPDAKFYQGQFSGYFYRTGFTMLNGEYYVFGGYGAGSNIFKLKGCALEQLEVTMPTQDYEADGAEVRTVVHADGSENAYICFTNWSSIPGYPYNSRMCDSFNGTTAVSQPYVSSASTREDSSMANYKGGLLVFGGYGVSDTEVFTPEVGFSEAAPMITAANRMSSLTIGTDRVFMFGGVLEGEGITDKIFMYYDDEWSFAGNMVVANFRTTAIMTGSSIIVSSGLDSGKIQQFEWDGSTISEGKIVEDLGDFSQLWSPIVIPELLEECDRPTNEFIFGAPLGETVGNYTFTALDFSLKTKKFTMTTTDYFKGVILDMHSGSFDTGFVNYKGQIYMMGGNGRLFTKIFKFTGSTTEEVALSGDPYTGYMRLYGNNPVVGWQDNQERIFLCFNSDSKNSCQTFDGSVIRNVEAETVYEHYQGCIGTFERNKEVVAIGGLNSAGKVEIFDGTSWRDGPDQPNNLTIKAVSVEVGAGIITLGGYGDLNGFSAYLLTYDNMINNTKKWVDLGQLKSYFVNFSAFRFGEIIVAYRGTGIHMLTWDGNNLDDQGIQIDLHLYAGSGGGIFIPKEDTNPNPQ